MMKSRKWLLLGLIPLSVGLLTGCGNSTTSQDGQNSKRQSDNNDPNSVLGSTSSSASYSSQSNNSQSNSSQSDNAKTKPHQSHNHSSQLAQSSSKSSQYQPLSGEQIGTILWLKINPTFIKQMAKVNGMTYRATQKNSNRMVNNYSSMSANGDPTSFLYYKVQGNMITYKHWVYKKSVAQGHFQTKITSVQNLVQQNYHSGSQKAMVDNLVSRLANNNNK